MYTTERDNFKRKKKSVDKIKKIVYNKYTIKKESEEHKMTKLTFKVNGMVFNTMKEAKAYQEVYAKTHGDGFWGVPEIEQVYTEEGCVPHGVSEYEGFVNPKLKIKEVGV